jgi:hypothetical protein
MSNTLQTIKPAVVAGIQLASATLNLVYALGDVSYALGQDARVLHDQYMVPLGWWLLATAQAYFQLPSGPQLAYAGIAILEGRESAGYLMAGRDEPKRVLITPNRTSDRILVTPFAHNGGTSQPSIDSGDTRAFYTRKTMKELRSLLTLRGIKYRSADSKPALVDYLMRDDAKSSIYPERPLLGRQMPTTSGRRSID